jgi:hypothetical protein
MMTLYLSVLLFVSVAILIVLILARGAISDRKIQWEKDQIL